MDSDAHVIEGLTRWLRLRRGFRNAYVLGVSRPKGGYSSETIFFDAAWTVEDQATSSSMVLRMAPQKPGTIADYNLVSQFEAQLCAANAGVPIANPILETDPQWVGAPFIVMPRVAGRVITQSPYLDPWVASLSTLQREQLVDQLLIAVAAVHRARFEDAPHVPRRDNTAELDHWEEYLSWSCHGHPIKALADALRWCRFNCPEIEPQPALLWGDVRFENCVYGTEFTLQAVLDWDMTSIGAPEHDLAWFTSLDFTMQHLVGGRLAGFWDRADVVARFEELSGRSIMHLAWYETFAMLRSTAILTRINVLRQDMGRPLLFPFDKNPMLDLLAMRLT